MKPEMHVFNLGLRYNNIDFVPNISPLFIMLCHKTAIIGPSVIFPLSSEAQR